jgi:hypothetical protein
MEWERRPALSCWVAPKIAAEIWGLALGDILDLVASGTLRSSIEGGFGFVRLPHFAVFGERLPIEKRPPTFNPIETVLHSEKIPGDKVVTPAERDALESDPADESEMGPPPDEDPNDNRIAGWREGRKRAGSMRRGPQRAG